MSTLPVQPIPGTASESPTNTPAGLVPINPGMVAPEAPGPVSTSPGVAVAAPTAPHPQAPTQRPAQGPAQDPAQDQASPDQAAPLRGVATGPNGEQGVFLSDEEVDADLFKEDHTLHIGVASICGGLAFVIFAGIGLVNGGLLGGIGLAVLGTVLLAVYAAIGTGALWTLGKLFAEDFGSFHILMLRAAAVVSAQVVALFGFVALAGPGLGMLVALPVQFFIASWLLGMGTLQAFVFVVLMKIIEWLLFAFVAMSIVSAVMA